MNCLLSAENGVPEIFYSVQGEGKFAGVPSVFVRFAGCNLACSWCDSAYTWRFTESSTRQGQVIFDKQANTLKMTTDEVVAIIRTHDKAMNVVFTGGEPMLQQKCIMDIIEKLDSWCTYEIETNGTVPTEIPCTFPFRRLSYNVSPKLGSSNMAGAEVRCASYCQTGEDVYFKFVVKNEEDMKEILSFVEVGAVQKSRIAVMPEGVTKKELKKNRKLVVDFAMAHGFRYSERLHVIIFGNKRFT